MTDAQYTPGIVAWAEVLEVAREVAREPCKTVGAEDLEAGCCLPCRARAALAQVTTPEVRVVGEGD